MCSKNLECPSHVTSDSYDWMCLFSLSEGFRRKNLKLVAGYGQRWKTLKHSILGGQNKIPGWTVEFGLGGNGG